MLRIVPYAAIHFGEQLSHIHTNLYPGVSVFILRSPVMSAACICLTLSVYTHAAPSSRGCTRGDHGSSSCSSRHLPFRSETHSPTLPLLLSAAFTLSAAVTRGPTGSYEYIRRFIVQLAGAEGGHGPDAPSALPVYDLMAGSASGRGGRGPGCRVHMTVLTAVHRITSALGSRLHAQLCTGAACTLFVTACVCAAGAIAVVATYPLDLVRTRLAWATEAPAQQQLAAVAAAGEGCLGADMQRHQMPRPCSIHNIHSHRRLLACSSRQLYTNQSPKVCLATCHIVCMAESYIIYVVTGGASPRAVHQQPGIWATLRGTMAEEGLAGLYRGCAPTLLVSTDSAHTCSSCLAETVAAL